MTTIVINENTEEGRSLMNVIRAMRKSSDAIVDIFDEKDEYSDLLPSGRIPGLPYTKEEQIASIRQSVEDIRAGRTVSLEELRAKHPRV